jgi:hypothetical protein
VTRDYVEESESLESDSTSSPSTYHAQPSSFDMVSPSKRKKHEEGEDSEEVTAKFVCNLIRTSAGGSVGEFILDMARNESLTLQDLKALTDKLPAFASADWEKVALTFGLDPTVDKYQLPPFSIPHAYLPPSFHRRVMKDSMQWLDVYQERGSQKREAARVRLMDAVRFTHCFLFYELTVSFSGTFLYAPFSKAA